ncbi:MAG: PQQ-binding-like beta-propeller repeat protein [Bryobacterales bacterium]|nr:PQQ-binding-like beta-propeller repeat protein [Bryobacterales bacterium]
MRNVPAVDFLSSMQIQLQPEGYLGGAETLAVENGMLYVGTLNANGAVYVYDVRTPGVPILAGIRRFSESRESNLGPVAMADGELIIGGSVGFRARQPRNLCPERCRRMKRCRCCGVRGRSRGVFNRVGKARAS